MKIIDMITVRVAKIMNGDKRAAKIQDLIERAYEAGRRDAATDIVITLEDDTDCDHADAIELITANF